MILGGVDTERFRFEPEGRAEVRARYGFTDDECVVGLLGRFDLVKGQRETIAALAKLVGEGVRNIRLLLLGFSTATLQEEVEAWIREAGMERYVTITGKVPDVTACLSALDVGVVASLWSETIARAALEIMAAGGRSYPLQWGHADLLPRRHWLRKGWALAGVAAAATDEAAAGLGGHC
ncbi:MAG: glycosyltransferase [Bilophila wadsworthia]